MIFTIIIIGLLYVFMIAWLSFGITKLTETNSSESDYTIAFSVIIPFKDEAQQLPDLLESIIQLKYPRSKFEILFVNDASIDASEEMIEKTLATTSINFTILQNKQTSNSPKKDAITLGIMQSEFDWIVTTDADCIVPKQWLSCFANGIQNKETVMLAAPVSYRKPKNFFEQFQTIDFLSLQGATMGGFGLKKPFLCNGANLCYLKNVFKNVNGYEGNDHITSGDDIFLMDKFRVKYQDKIWYLKEKNAIVKTKPVETIKQLINQRVRWASKTSATKNIFSKMVGLLVLSLHFSLLLSFVLGILFTGSWMVFVGLFLSKLIVDFMLLYKTATFFNMKFLLRNYLIFGIIYPFFTLTIFLFAFKQSYTWKGKDYKK